MNKVFGYTQNSGKDWFTSSPYQDREIEAIKDPQGGNNISLPTAIPTPFARIDLVKTAFKNIANTPQLKAYSKNGNVVASREDEKLVSDALDLLELLFNRDNVPGLRIITWDIEASMQALKYGSIKHKRFGETLKLYLDQDSEAYNFDLMRRIFLFEYNHKIIGGTSPVTLTFASANDLSFAQLNLTGKDVLFDNKYASLHERDEDFQKYIYLLFKANPILSQRMTGMEEYLRKNLEVLSKLNNKLYTEINQLRGENFLNSFSELDTGNTGEVIEVIGVTLRKRKKEDILAAVRNSDFIIGSDKFLGENKPLVLQNNLNKDYRYINDLWDNKVKVPYFEKETILDKRLLPGVKITYPYLTVGDFLEPTLIRLVYPINKQKFFEGNVLIESGDDTKGYILPLKPLFFEFFDTEDLQTGKVRIDLTQRALNAVKVVLHIPVSKKGEFITFERLYSFSEDFSIISDEQAGKDGVIIEQQFGITLFPFIKVNNPEIHSFYRVQLIDRNITSKVKNTNYGLQFYANSNASKPLELKVQPSKRSEKTAFGAGSHYYVLDKEFDYIQVKNQLASGIIIPNWNTQPSGNKKFSFAVDFGTTNTHIEYKVGKETPKPFDITTDDIQIATLFDPNRTSDNFGGTDAIDIRELIDEEFVPYLLGKNADYKFPHRTVLAESANLNIKSETFTLADFNIPFVYGRKLDKGTVHTGLKWAKKDNGNEKRVRAYFEKLIMLLRNKVLLNGGNLSETELIWFYPSSMKTGRKGDLGNTWSELFELYFKPEKKPIGIIESLAPFYYFKGANKLPGGSTYRPVVSIDIGGGTTDVVIFQKSVPLALTSFKFASNALFGDGFADYGSLGSNGIAEKYYSHFEELFSKNKLYDLTKVLESIKEKNKAEDINTFFFSVESNPKIKDKSLFSYNAELKKDENLKILFLYFYSAIIYHIAQLMKANDIELPKHIVFSGTGSKVLSIITSDLTILSDFSQLIFEEVYGKKYNEDELNITRENEMPKEVTCKGGLMCDANDLAINVNKIKTIFTCINGINTLTYGDLNDNNKNEIVESVQQFNAIFFALDKKMKYSDSFTVAPQALSIFKNQVNKNVRDYLEEGIEFNRKLDGDISSDKEIEESLFFYPLIGIINNLTKTLSGL
jgi:hypothetical protein